MRKVLVIAVLGASFLHAGWTTTFDMCAKVPLYLNKQACEGFAGVISDGISTSEAQAKDIKQVCTLACKQPIMYKDKLRPKLVAKEAKDIQ